MRILMIWRRRERRPTEPWGVSFALFLFGVLMPKGESTLLGHEISWGVHLQLPSAVVLFALISSVLLNLWCDLVHGVRLASLIYFFLAHSLSIYLCSIVVLLCYYVLYVCYFVLLSLVGLLNLGGALPLV